MIITDSEKPNAGCVQAGSGLWRGDGGLSDKCFARQFAGILILVHATQPLQQHFHKCTEHRQVLRFCRQPGMELEPALFFGKNGKKGFLALLFIVSGLYQLTR